MTDEMHMYSYETLTHAESPAVTSYLFLGGSEDGQVLDVPGYLQTVHVASVPSQEEVYVRQRLAGEAETFEVFAPSDWTGDMLIRHLLLRATKGARQ